MVVRTEPLSLKTVRQHCLDCSGGSTRYVLWCPCDGHNSTSCSFWPHRFGQRPETFIGKVGPHLLTPDIMPDARVDLDELPGTVSAASAWLRERHPEIEWAGPRIRTAAEIELAKRAGARLTAIRQEAQEGKMERPGPLDFPRKPK